MAEYNERYLMLMHLHRRQQAMQAARRKRRGPKLSKRVRQVVIARDDRTCGICGTKVAVDEEVHIDHILPVSAGGTNAVDNLQVAHARCNLLKGAKV